MGDHIGSKKHESLGKRDGPEDRRIRVPNGGSTILSFLEVRWGKHIEPVEGDHTKSKRLPLAALRVAIAEQQDEGWLGRGPNRTKAGT
jgi:hypothetical protein